MPSVSPAQRAAEPLARVARQSQARRRACRSRRRRPPRLRWSARRRVMPRPASTPTSPTTRIAPAVKAGADAVEPLGAALEHDLLARRRRADRTDRRPSAHPRRSEFAAPRFRRRSCADRCGGVRPERSTRCGGGWRSRKVSAAHGISSLQPVVMLAELAAVIAGADAQRAALGPELDDRLQPRAHRVGDGFAGQPVDDDLQHRRRSRVRARCRPRLSASGSRRWLVEAIGALVFGADLGAGAHDAARKRHDRIRHGAHRLDGGFGRARASSAASRP